MQSRRNAERAKLDTLCDLLWLGCLCTPSLVIAACFGVEVTTPLAAAVTVFSLNTAAFAFQRPPLLTGVPELSSEAVAFSIAYREQRKKRETATQSQQPRNVRRPRR